jgi:hypothetical protein
VARNFNGTTDYLTGTVGALSGMDAGPITIAAIIRLDANTPGSSIIYAGGGDVTGVDLGIYDGLFYLGSQEPSLATASTADGWHLVAANKAAGTATPRWHKYVISSDTWTHTNAGSTMGDGVAVAGGDTLQIGRWGTASTRFVGDIAIVGVWDRVLTDAEIELLPFSLQAWYASAPKACLLLDQATAATSVVDLTGGGANITGGTGTTVATSSLPIFSYGFDSLAPHSVPGAAGTNASAECATAAGTANASTTSIAPASGHAAATGTANPASSAVAPRVGAAAATAAAGGATVVTGTLAAAGVATAAATAAGPASSVAPGAVTASATGTATSAGSAVTTTAIPATVTATAPSAAAGVNASAVLAAAAAVVNAAATAVAVGASAASASASALQASANTGVPTHAVWTAGRPEPKWATGRPEAKWTAGPPEGG